MTKEQEALELLQALRGANISYKEFARVAGINMNSLYTWTQKKKLPEKKAEYIINAVKYYFPNQYEIITINKSIREVLERGGENSQIENIPKILNIPPQRKEV